MHILLEEKSKEDGESSKKKLKESSKSEGESEQFTTDQQNTGTCCFYSLLIRISTTNMYNYKVL